ncbi:pentapeptide repeat-containing protein [Brucepastera parasyntrophica]|uniref:pentapeptide repeat-containing protein n=1 Tax=Brucepastera parasyntrophica TaxID=2880008 RepID=UPI00210B04C8|nr:pentapeptide repeat-containing protein [Brucepastera parasyntrophica]ULQ59547.1 pentapeptide repeat-containing protein [Brucepastera parasyntrophica]
MDKKQTLSDFETSNGSMLKTYIEKAIENDYCINNIAFENEELSEVDASGIEFENVQFIKCDLKKCDFSRSRFYDVDFENCNISLSNFSKTFWKKVKIAESNAAGAQFIDSLIKETKITNSIFDYSNFANSAFTNCVFDNCKFNESYFSESKIKKLQLKKVTFIGTDFFKTSLRGIDLSDCIIDGIKISADFFELKGSKINSQQALELVKVFDIEIV